ncbi:MAG TPA: hypothetical protein VFH23_05410 [Jiangellaceae bacterium]|nr:hypothetical protein [Jiangellaceae bacterium]
MGAILDDLDGQEGYPLRRLTDGTTTSRWTSATNRFTGYIAACDCGWTGTGHYEPTDAGHDAALDEWEHDHARPLLEYVIPTRVQQQLQEALRSLDDLAAQRPRAAAKALRHLDAGRTAIARRLDERLAAHEPASRRAVLRRQHPGRGLGL